jgi:tRNA-splicing ligase RtcB
MHPITLVDLEEIAPCTWEIPRAFRNDMRVKARLYASRQMVEHLLAERALEQLVNTAALPGVQEPVLAMPDIHQGYGFPIGGVVAVRAEDGVISPGGVGYKMGRNGTLGTFARAYHTPIRS